MIPAKWVPVRRQDHAQKRRAIVSKQGLCNLNANE
jgi:hypothetical protein